MIMKKGLKIFLIVAVVGLIAGLSTVYYIFNMPHRDVENEAPAFIIEAEALFDEYNSDEDVAHLKYGNQVIQVSGEIVELSNEGYEVSIILNNDMEGVSCSLDSIAITMNKEFVDQLKLGDNITLKGKCDGFDMIMGVVLTRCYIIE